MVDGSSLSYSMSLRYYSSRPSSSSASVLTFTTKLGHGDKELKEGSATQIIATIGMSFITFPLVLPPFIAECNLICIYVCHGNGN
jgi:hypothetical protein